MTALFGPEGRPWDGNIDAKRLSPSAYAAGALFGVAEMAVKTIHRHGGEISGTEVMRYSKAFASILLRAHLELGEPGGWGSSMNMRLRGALWTALEVSPYDETDGDTPDDSWRDWTEHLYSLVVNTAKTAAWLHGIPPRGLVS